jgi:hypothetical protein
MKALSQLALIALTRSRALVCAGALPLLAGALPGCVCNAGSRDQERRDFGELAELSPTKPADAAAALAKAREVLLNRQNGAAAPADRAAKPEGAGGRRVMLASFRPRAEPAVATAMAATESDAAVAAAEALAKIGGGPGRIELDVPTALEPADLDGDMERPLTSIGLQGVLVTRDDGRTGVVLPSEIAERDLFHQAHQGKSPRLNRDRIVQILAARAGVTPADLRTMRAYFFRADAFVEPAPAGSPPDESHAGSPPDASQAQPPQALSIVRGMVAHPERATPERLLAAVRHGADYLVRVLSADGRYVYLYHPLDDRDDKQYGWLRHAGTTYALLEAYEEFGTAAYLEKSEVALQYLTAHLHDDAPSQGKYALDSNDEEQQKVGGAGLALLAYAKHAAVTGKRDRLDTMRALARFIMKQQYEDGRFRANADVEKETGQKLKREPVYYPGEAALGLLRLYAVDPQQAYLDTARRAADWVIQVRDASVSEENQEHDHWMSYVLNELYRLTHDGAYIDFAYKIARAIEKKQHRAADAPAPDWPGTFYEGQTTPASTRVEAYDADIAVSRFAGKPDAWLLDLAQEVACSMLGQQFDPQNDYWLKNPAKAEGGVRESLFVQDVRIDYVQHAMSAWLHLARILRDPAYGRTGVPSQDPVRDPSQDQVR